ncbi:hypothetical protein EGW08_017897 [Elysia chlorotica]|uniref:Uncharacterized protein n=1 Tax=Elysia chlorotica TaxID=188477 RepID=A0A433SYG4_ELYCH|nr:hypothetical protein EGW08_017897 [Elysia chlorotica]
MLKCWDTIPPSPTWGCALTSIHRSLLALAGRTLQDSGQAWAQTPAMNKQADLALCPPPRTATPGISATDLPPQTDSGDKTQTAHSDAGAILLAFCRESIPVILGISASVPRFLQPMSRLTIVLVSLASASGSVHDHRRWFMAQIYSRTGLVYQSSHRRWFMAQIYSRTGLVYQSPPGRSDNRQPHEYSWPLNKQAPGVQVAISLTAVYQARSSSVDVEWGRYIQMGG